MCESFQINYPCSPETKRNTRDKIQSVQINLQFVSGKNSSPFLRISNEFVPKRLTNIRINISKYKVYKAVL